MEEWAAHLRDYPEDADMCYKWDEFDGEAWLWLLRKQPQFADKCDWSKLNDKNWEELLKVQPQFADKRK